MANQRISGLAIVAFILSLLFFIPFVPLIGLILGIIAIIKMNKNKSLKGQGLAIAAIIIGFISLIIGSYLILLVLSMIFQARMAAWSALG